MLKRFDLKPNWCCFFPHIGTLIFICFSFQTQQMHCLNDCEQSLELALEYFISNTNRKEGRKKVWSSGISVICYFSAEDLCCAYGNVPCCMILIILFCLLPSEHLLGCGVSGFSCSITFYRGRSKFCCPVGFLSSYILWERKDSGRGWHVSTCCMHHVYLILSFYGCF